MSTGSPVVGFLAAALASAVLSLSFGFLTQVLLSNQVATGLGLTLVGLGLSALVGAGFEGVRAPGMGKLWIPGLAEIPVIGPMFFRHDFMVYVSLLLVAAVWGFLKYTRAGLILRAVGEDHESAHALGYKVVRVRMAAIFFGGACAGLGGAYVSLVRVPQWTEGMTAGGGLDRAGHRRLRQLARVWRADRRVSFRRRHRAAAEPAGGGGQGARRAAVDVALPDHHPRAGDHLGPRGAWRARIAGPLFPRLRLSGA